MSTTAPKPPTKRLLLAAGLSTGITGGIWAITAVGHLVFSGIPANRIPYYVGVGVIGFALSGYLCIRYAIQKHRRDAWLDGHTACDDTAADALPLRRIQAELELLTEAVIDLADAAGRPRAPQPRAQPTGSTYASRAAQNDTVLIPRHAEPSAADAPVQLAERQPADPEAEARAQGYAEGYVDGIARRQEGTEAN